MKNIRWRELNLIIRAISGQRIHNTVFIIATLLSLTSCVQTSDTYLRSGSIGSARQTPSATVQSQTIDLEASDRIARFRRLAEMMGTSPPQVDELLAPAGTVPGVSTAVPVVRLIFEERVFFDFNQAVLRADAAPAIEIVAANMKRDVPDAALTILGHTDGIGSDAYNVALSQRRASTVLGHMIGRGLNPNQLSTVAIGKAQPIAPNSTEEGRALNRRVEFLISGSEQANLSVIRDRPIKNAFLTLLPNQRTPESGPRTVEVLKPIRRPVGEDYEGILGPAGLLTLRTPERGPLIAEPASAPQILPSASATPVVPKVASPAPAVIPREPEVVLPAPLRDSSPASF
jgi:outer membrane protein OmpA-like peptidoglycan-associated protein